MNRIKQSINNGLIQIYVFRTHWYIWIPFKLFCADLFVSDCQIVKIKWCFLMKRGIIWMLRVGIRFSFFPFFWKNWSWNHLQLFFDSISCLNSSLLILPSPLLSNFAKIASICSFVIFFETCNWKRSGKK